MEGSLSKKYQFFITYKDAVKASAASKPLADTCKTLSSLGYRDYSLTFNNGKKNLSYYALVLASFINFFFKIKSGSIVATQYPTPTVGYLFIWFIRLASLRGIKFITIIHDINTLRAKELKSAELRKEIRMLSSYHGLVVHNNVMKEWLVGNGLNKLTITVPLKAFDYISSSALLTQKISATNNNEIAFAGHLVKSVFVYNLQHIKNWKFNIYGSDFDSKKNENPNTTWKGEYSPDEIVYNLEGSFGLVWDGADSANIASNTFGNYMRYNNPFKFSLYLAAGLPVIAPKTAAIANMILENKIGFLIDTLEDLNDIEVSKDDYEIMIDNVKQIQKDIIAGNYLRTAVQLLETKLAYN